jgi:hypothetical protein
MPNIVRILLLAASACFVLNGEASAKSTSYCYFHHSCPEDGKMSGLHTKRQCKNGGGKSWGDGPMSCENVNK